MSSLIDRALRLWTEPMPAGHAALEAFGAVYTDPLDVNGTSTALQVLVDRARMLQAALADLCHDVHERVEAPGRQAFAFRLGGRHVGPLETSVGRVEATGLQLTWSGMDIFLVDEKADRVTGLWAIGDLVEVLLRAGALERSG